MPLYLYKCPACDYRHEDYQLKHTGSRDIMCPMCRVLGQFDDGDIVLGNLMKRDYAAERPSVISDWEPGYNPGIDYHYKNKGDLLAEIKRRGFYPSVHGGGVTRTKPGLYGEEEYKHIYDYSKPVDDSELTVPVNEEEG